MPVPAGVFEALGDPVRRRILELLTGSERPAGELVAALQPDAAISQPAVSQHLKVLRDAGLVQVRPEGTRRIYAVDAAGVGAAQAWLTQIAGQFEQLGQFAQPLDALATEVARGQRTRRTAPPTAGTNPGSRTRPA